MVARAATYISPDWLSGAAERQTTGSRIYLHPYVHTRTEKSVVIPSGSGGACATAIYYYVVELYGSSYSQLGKAEMVRERTP